MKLPFTIPSWGLPVIALIAAGVATLTIYLQSQHIDSLNDTVKAKNQIIADRDTAIQERDAKLTKQTTAINDLVEAGRKQKLAYEAAYARADERAKSHDQRAIDLLAIPTPDTDELAQCRAARELILKEYEL